MQCQIKLKRYYNKAILYQKMSEMDNFNDVHFRFFYVI